MEKLQTKTFPIRTQFKFCILSYKKFIEFLGFFLNKMAFTALDKDMFSHLKMYLKFHMKLLDL